MSRYRNISRYRKMFRLTQTFQQARNPRLLAASAVIGIGVALVVAAFEKLALHVVLENLLEQHIVVLAVAPVLGIVAARALLLLGGRNTSVSTSDEYIRAFHERHPHIRMRELPAKLLAGIATIGGGGSLGLEGPSIYAGSSIGLFVHERMGRFFRRDEARILLTAGAAAGVSAVFKTPATGVIFALEAPYDDDVTPQALVPSLIASAAGYTAFVALLGSEPVVPVIGRELSGETASNAAAVFSPLQLDDVLGAIILGLLAGLAGRVFGWLVRRTKRAVHDVAWPRRVVVAGLVLAGLVVLSDAAFGQALSLGPGTEAMEWVLDENGLELIALLFGIRMAATLTTVYGGGVGGLFIPLCTLGLIVGQFVETGIHSDIIGLYPTLGLAAFLGAAYRTPIAAVMFVAESTRGGGTFVVPALIAAAVSQVVCGRSSVAEYQRDRRLGHLESRFMLPLSSIVTTDVFTVPPDATVSEFVYGHVLGRRERVVPVVSGDAYLGMARLDDLSSVDRAAWETTTVESIMATDLPSARLSWTLRDAMRAMDNADIDVLAVTDNAGSFVGMVTEDDAVKLGEILDETEVSED